VKTKFRCQQCKKELELETVFNYEVCPACNGNLFPVDYVNPIDFGVEKKLKDALENICKFDLKPYENDKLHGADKLKMIAFEALK